MTQVGQVDPVSLISLSESGALPLPASLYFRFQWLISSSNCSKVIEDLSSYKIATNLNISRNTVMKYW